MDRKLVSNQRHEISYFKTHWGVPAKEVRAAKAEVGISRVKIMAWLILHDKIADGYLIKFDNILL